MTIKTFTRPVGRFLERIGLLARREDFLKIFPKNSTGAELGVFQGKFSRAIIEIVQPRELHLIDPWWKAAGEFYGEWSRYHNGGELLSTRKAYEQARANVKAVDRKGVAVFHVEDDLECLARFEDGYFDWVYIDSSHRYDHTVKELELARRKVKPGGIIAGHDWRPDPNHIHHGVYKAVHEFCRKYGWAVFRLDRHTQWAIRQAGGVLK